MTNFTIDKGYLTYRLMHILEQVNLGSEDFNDYDLGKYKGAFETITDILVDLSGERYPSEFDLEICDNFNQTMTFQENLAFSNVRSEVFEYIDNYDLSEMGIFTDKEELKQNYDALEGRNLEELIEEKN